ncbi:hypothetical protein ACJRO7_005716 [Eucalyptus globulus]|uniref:Uncharacterized protein n=1 Tax=Eucalyptus globulus TaxID=34317 RepID=A0ABD3J0B1_EUCGL
MRDVGRRWWSYVEGCGGGLEQTKLRWFWEEDGQSTIIKKILKPYRNRHQPRGRNRGSRCRGSSRNRKTRGRRSSQWQPKGAGEIRRTTVEEGESPDGRRRDFFDAMGKLARAVKWFALEVTRWAPKYLLSPKFKMGLGGPRTSSSVRPVLTWNLGQRGFSFENASLTRSDKEIMGRHIEWGFIIGARGLTMRDVVRRW